MHLLKPSAWVLSGILLTSACLSALPVSAESTTNAMIAPTEQMQPVLDIAHDDPVCTDSDGDGECDSGSSTD